MNARTLALPASLDASVAAPSGLGAVVSAFAAFVKGVLTQPAAPAVIAEVESGSIAYTQWRELSAELMDVQYGYVGNVHGAARDYLNATAR